jgi:hypothetical protein
MDRLKYIPLNRADNVHLAIGGELRLRYERFTNDTWTRLPQTTAATSCNAICCRPTSTWEGVRAASSNFRAVSRLTATADRAGKWEIGI